ncbi:paired amphipathic helix protein Sin3-like 1, partial [Carica papaya]|uniref:paired amphipathic helix protein Sin3-like 1 n=1 Tax=Carica papaya TaxID=3649 RepID=UPI000B8CD700
MQKEDDILLAIAAGRGPYLVPHLEYEYSDICIHEDLYKLVQFSCEEICSTKDQFNKVMRLWTAFLEPMLGIPPHSDGHKGVEDVGNIKRLDVNCSTSGIAETDGSPGTDTNLPNAKQLKSADNGDDNASQMLSKFNGAGNVDSSTKQSLQVGKEQKNTEPEKRSATSTHTFSVERVASSIALLAIGTENIHGRTGSEVMSGSHAMPSRPGDAISEDNRSDANLDVVSPSE